MLRKFLKIYGLETSLFVSGWCEKISVGCFLVAFFQPQPPVFMSLTIGILFFSLALYLKIITIHSQ